MIETLVSLAWQNRPIPPLGVAPWYRRRRWFRWYVTYQIEYLIWRVRQWRWQRRTGGIMVPLW